MAVRPSFTTVCFAAAILLGVLPLWAGVHVPMVDLPQHLHLISVLHRLSDDSTLYPQWFEARGQLTPYLGYYETVNVLNWLMPIETANRVFLSAYVAGLPLSLAFLLRSFKRPVWPALLSLPFAYGDSFAWGFINYIAALPLSFLCCGLFVRAIADVPKRRSWAIGLALCLVAVLLMHVQAFAWLGVALPILLLTTSAPDDVTETAKALPADRSTVKLIVRMGKPLEIRARHRIPALLGVVPGVVLFLIWVGLRVGQPQEVEAGAPWKAWGPMLSPQNLSYKPFAQNLSELTSVLANMLRDGSDRAVLNLVVVIAVAGLVAGGFSFFKKREDSGANGLIRLVLITAAGLLLYFVLPFDIRGYMYYLNTRYAHLVVPLALCCVPVIDKKLERGFLVACVVAALVLCVPLYKGFAQFDSEARDFDNVEAAAAPKAKVMGFIFDTASAVMTHPVYLHMGAELARKSGGVANFSFALTPHSPVKYKLTPPPAPPSEWNPGQFNWNTMGSAYDHFLIRGPPPERVLGQWIGSELVVAAQSGNVSLVERRR
ncbi:MAG: hypothetical protein ACJ790_11480 [Myxococcaceae bacterium]